MLLFQPRQILAARPSALVLFLFVPESRGSAVSREKSQIIYGSSILGSPPNSKKNDCIDLYFYLSRLGFDEPGDGL